MDIAGTLIQGALPTFAANNTGGAGNDTRKNLADGIFETILPLFGTQFNPLFKILMVVWNKAGISLGFDPTIILTIAGVVWAANKLLRQLYGTLYGLTQQYFTASINISNSDEMYNHMMKWLAGQPKLVNSRSLTAETFSRTMWEGEDGGDLVTGSIGADGTGIMLNFSNQEAKAPPRFIPAFGLHGFWFEGRYYRIHRKQESLYDDGNSSGMPQFKDKEKLAISCFGRSPEPIKKLLQLAKEQYYADHHAKTIVKRPSPQNLRRYGGRHSWQQVANRPVRPMNTVVLDEKQKVAVLSDMNEYLHPATPRWYAARGIPLRRGYLFHGPPGTGKTSLSFALAGVFGLDIHVISLLDPSLTEEDLSALFSSLPRRCVVLLEDIDTAGLSRPDDSKPEDGKQSGKKGAKDGSKDKDDWSVSDLARELRKQGDSTEKKGISLSGLLNAIDGVASHEGRVLIMTTNKPESLDDALIRPGRVDMQVAFNNATRQQALELFVRMYEAESKMSTTLSQEISLSTASTIPSTPTEKDSSDLSDGSITEVEVEDLDQNADDTAASKLVSAKDEAERPVTTKELASIAFKFSEIIPEGQIISPAEIQGFLLKRKKNPRRALLEVNGWVTALLEQKASKTKILQVQ
ncbi:BCS1 N terminal-domain-containing protein [Cercophora newfieldiana]|uniref:BCS1 N terminal-domain-containing protein n=1 Tax=Cercophora newfieldiana TaxID=92897 RepID=A0AA39YFR6_9PEZI|nr:BCS1 N terminal-domain-containing protein [Cercophora newfieldiana]